LIPQAEAIADSLVVTTRCASEDGGGESFRKWTRCFSITMDELSKPLLNGADG
jgi:hypothetical protein